MLSKSHSEGPDMEITWLVVVIIVLVPLVVVVVFCVRRHFATVFKCTWYSNKKIYRR